LQVRQLEEESINALPKACRFSMRADREEQFQSDFEAYARLESAGQDFDYVLITIEFDAARLKAACERRKQNAAPFSSQQAYRVHAARAAQARRPACCAPS
jgi:hypothetical protein